MNTHTLSHTHTHALLGKSLHLKCTRYVADPEYRIFMRDAAERERGRLAARGPFSLPDIYPQRLELTKPQREGERGGERGREREASAIANPLAEVRAP